MKADDVYRVLQQLDIPYEKFDHPPVFTVAEATEHWKEIDATHCKNLFFRDKKGRQHYLVVLPSDKQLDVKSLSRSLGRGRLSFGSEERLMKWLGLTPGSVSPFGLINDPENHVKVFIDSDLQQASKLGFHPNDNRVTLVIKRTDFEKYLEWTGNEYQFFDI
jgi:Ala-tRNA(Pro) deacylase